MTGWERKGTTIGEWGTSAGVGERGRCTAGHTGTWETSLFLEIQSRRRTRRGTNEPGFHPSLEEERGRLRKRRQHEKKGDRPVPPNEGRRNEAGRAMRGRSTAIVPMKRGNRNRRDPDLSEREGLYLEEGNRRLSEKKRTDGRKQHGYFGLIVRDILG